MAERNLDIEALRGLAIALTLTAHAGILIPQWGPTLSYFWLGSGVDLFFAISGFVIASGLLPAFASPTPFRSIVVPFWTRRAFRLWPAAVFWACAMLFLALFVQRFNTLGTKPDMFLAWLAGVLNVENLWIAACGNDVYSTCGSAALNPYWSLSLEEQFYFVLPFLFLMFRQRLLLLAGLMLFPAAFQFFAHRPLPNILWLIRTDALIYGVLIATAWHLLATKMERFAIHANRRAVQAGLVAMVGILVFVTRADISPFFMGIVAVAAGAIVLLVSPNRRFITGRPTVAAFAKYLGSRSYSIYLVHYMVFSILRDAALWWHPHFWTLPVGEITLAGTALLSIAALSELSYRVIEMPLRLHGRHVAAGMEARGGTARKASDPAFVRAA